MKIGGASMDHKKLDRLPQGVISPKAQCFEKEIRAMVCGQDRAIRYFTSAFESFWARRKDPRHPDRPIISMILVGPSGVGKTESVRALAKHFLGSPERFTRINCGDFQSGYEVTRLTGASPGYVGYDLEPQLSQANIDRPFLEWEVEVGKYYGDAITMREKALVNMEKDYERVSKEFFKKNNEFTTLKEEFERLTNIPTKDRSKDDEKIIEVLARRLFEMEPLVESLGKKVEGLLEMIDMTRKIIDAYKTQDKLKEEDRVSQFNALFLKAENLKAYNSSPRKDALSIILFDEIEEGHPDLRRVLLSVLDQGILQMARGGTTRFGNSIVVMTTNLGSKAVNELMQKNNPFARSSGSLGFIGPRKALDKKGEQNTDQQIYEICSDALSEEFEPKFLGRINKVVAFRPLSFEVLLEILSKLVADFNDGAMRGTSCGVAVEIILDDELKRHMVRESMKKLSEGARMLEKRFKEYVDDYLSPLINTGEIKNGDRILFKLEGKRPVLFKIQD